MTDWQTFVAIAVGAIAVGLLVEINKKLGAVVLILRHTSQLDEDD